MPDLLVTWASWMCSSGSVCEVPGQVNSVTAANRGEVAKTKGPRMNNAKVETKRPRE